MFRLVAENVKDYALFIVDPHRRVLSWSKGAERLLGFSEQEIVGQRCDRFFTPEDVQNGVPQEELDEALRTGRGDDDRWHVRKDGSRFWSSGTVTPLREPGGTLRGFAKIMRDRTELKRAEETARERERQLQLLTDQAPVLIAHCDADRRYLFVNKPFAARFGLHPRQVVGRSIRDVLGEAVYAVIERYVDAALAGERVEFEVEVPYDDLGLQTMRCAYDPEFDADGRVRGFVAALVNVTERRRAERALRESEARLRAIIDNWPSVIFVKDPQGRYLLANKACEPIAGEPAERIVGKTDHDYLPAEVADRFRADDRRVLETGETLRYEEEAPLGGEVRTSLTVKFPLRDAAGRPYAVCGIATDITELKRAAEALRVSEERFARFMQHLPGLAWIKDSEGRYVYANDAAANAFGKTRAELYGRTDDEVFPPDTAAQFRENDRRALASGAGVRVVETLRHGDGVVHHSLVSKFPIPGPDGTAALAGGMAIDITEEVRTRAVLEESEERFRQLAENINAVFWMSDPRKAEMQYVSPAYERVWGRPCQSLYEQPLSFFEAIHPEDRDHVRAASLERQGRGEAVDVEYRVVRPDGSVRWVRDRSFPVRDTSGRVYRMAGIAEDITERKRAEQALREADRRKDEFLATLAHELRNPLAPLRNGLQVMRLARGNPEAVEQAQGMMERQLGQMVRLIDDLLDVSRITRGKLQLRRERADLASVVRSAVEGSRPLIEASGHELTVTLPPEPVYLEADPTRLAQVFANLLTNAAKYTERGGQIRLTAERQGGEVAVAVKDTGIGIAPEQMPRLFEMFSQAAPALERSQGGLGIGLSLVKGLVQMHGGTVEARSEGLGKGSEFVVRLPVAAAGPEQQSGSAGKREARSAPGRRILVADDNRDAAASLALMLRLGGHEVHTVHDGQEAVEAAVWFRPDVALLDIGMPKVNGYEAARRIRGRSGGKGLVLVAVTGWGQEEDKRKAAAAGFDHHLTKPVEPRALEQILAKARSVERPHDA